MVFKRPKIFALIVIYLPVMLLGTAQATICVSETGDLQLEFGATGCDRVPASSQIDSDEQECGNCTDTRIRFGETSRTHASGADNLPFCQQNQACEPEIKTSLPFQGITSHFACILNLISSSILNI